MDPAASSTGDLLLLAASKVPTSYYLFLLLSLALVFLYDFLEFHFLRDLVFGLRGDAVVLTYRADSLMCREIVKRCWVLRGRYLATPWLASPHLQTAFLNFFGRPPLFTYRRQLYSVQDGGTIALDWLLASEIKGHASNSAGVISEDDTTPIAIVVPGLTSDSSSSYIKHLVYVMAKQGWNVVVSNHRGLGGISITSDCFYNAGWTEDVREVVNHLKRQHPMAPLYAVGTSIGANILVKYLGEDGENTPLLGAAAICSPWDLVVCDRFISRKLVQRFYDRVLTIGLQGYAKEHESTLMRLANWEGMEESRSVRDFDNHVTCLVGKFETVDTYYRRCSSVNFVSNVSVPLLCISALDDPVCTREAIPWDECRANRNIVLATTAHGGHLAFFKGIGGSSLWWVEAVSEFLDVLHSRPYIHLWKEPKHPAVYSALESSIDKAPFVNIVEDGMVATMKTDEAGNKALQGESFDPIIHDQTPEIKVVETNQQEANDAAQTDSAHQSVDSLDQKPESNSFAERIYDVIVPMKNSINQLSRNSSSSIWLLAYIAVVTSWPLVGTALGVVFKRKLKGFLPAAWLRK